MDRARGSIAWQLTVCLATRLAVDERNIGIYHVRHLCSRIPFYRLPCVIKDHPALEVTSRLTIAESINCVRLVLWDETERRVISFRQLRSRLAEAAPTPAPGGSSLTSDDCRACRGCH